MIKARKQIPWGTGRLDIWKYLYNRYWAYIMDTPMALDLGNLHHRIALLNQSRCL